MHFKEEKEKGAFILFENTKPWISTVRLPFIDLIQSSSSSSSLTDLMIGPYFTLLRSGAQFREEEGEPTNHVRFWQWPLSAWWKRGKEHPVLNQWPCEPARFWGLPSIVGTVDARERFSAQGRASRASSTSANFK